VYLFHGDAKKNESGIGHSGKQSPNCSLPSSFPINCGAFYMGIKSPTPNWSDYFNPVIEFRKNTNLMNPWESFIKITNYSFPVNHFILIIYPFFVIKNYNFYHLHQ